MRSPTPRIASVALVVAAACSTPTSDIHRPESAGGTPSATAQNAAAGAQAKTVLRTARAGIVRADGRAFADDGGPFLALGTTLFWALWGFEHDRDRLTRNLEAISNAGFDYIRVLAIVGPGGWSDRTVDPRAPGWKERVSAFTDWAYDTHRLRIQWTVFGGVAATPTQDDRAEIVDRFASGIAGRHHKVFAVEIANEGWQNGFAGRTGQTELGQLAARLRSSYPGLLATTAPRVPSCRQQSSYYRGVPASFMTLHFPRGRDRWKAVRQPWTALATPCPDVPRAASNNEPIGPYSSVEEERDPLRLAASAAATWASGLGAYVLHTGAGIRGGGIEDRRRGRPANVWEVQDWPAITSSLSCVRSVLPDDLPNWRRLANEDHPFGAAGGVGANEPNPAVVSPDGDRSLVLLLDNAPRTSLEARRSLTARVVHPVSCEPLGEETLQRGESLTLEASPPAAIALVR